MRDRVSQGAMKKLVELHNRHDSNDIHLHDCLEDLRETLGSFEESDSDTPIGHRSAGALTEWLKREIAKEPHGSFRRDVLTEVAKKMVKLIGAEFSASVIETLTGSCNACEECHDECPTVCACDLLVDECPNCGSRRYLL